MPRYFNPRLQEGGDRHHTIRRKRGTDFNPRLQEGGDRDTVKIRVSGGISIHASKKEATYSIFYQTDLNNFNPRLQEGGDWS